MKTFKAQWIRFDGEKEAECSVWIETQKYISLAGDRYYQDPLKPTEFVNKVGNRIIVDAKHLDDWIDIKDEKPKPNQVVLVVAYLDNPVIMLAYVVKYKGRIEFGVANCSEFDRRKAIESFPITHKVIKWKSLSKI